MDGSRVSMNQVRGLVSPEEWQLRVDLTGQAVDELVVLHRAELDGARVVCRLRYRLRRAVEV